MELEFDANSLAGAPRKFDEGILLSREHIQQLTNAFEQNKVKILDSRQRREVDERHIVV